MGMYAEVVYDGDRKEFCLELSVAMDELEKSVLRDLVLNHLIDGISPVISESTDGKDEYETDQARIRLYPKKPMRLA